MSLVLIRQAQHQHAQGEHRRARDESSDQGQEAVCSAEADRRERAPFLDAYPYDDHQQGCRIGDQLHPLGPGRTGRGITEHGLGDRLDDGVDADDAAEEHDDPAQPPPRGPPCFTESTDEQGLAQLHGHRHHLLRNPRASV